MLSGQILTRLFLRGLGELLVLHTKGDQVLIGNIAVEKGKAVFKDRGFLHGISAAQVATSLEYGIVGVITDLRDRHWQTLTFLGITHCRIPVDLSATRTGLLRTTRGAQGDTLVDFEGSWYRGFQLMLEHHFLPVVAMIPVPTAKYGSGLAVCDLKMATLPLEMMQRIHNAVRVTVDKHLTVEVEDVDVDSEDFTRLFGAYLKTDGS